MDSLAKGELKCKYVKGECVFSFLIFLS